MKHLLVGVLLLTGCANKAAVVEACTIEKVLDIPVAGTASFIEVPALLDDHAATLALATGAEASMVTPTVMRDMQLHTDPRQGTILTDIGGSYRTQNALLRSFKIGQIEMLDQSLAVGPLPVSPQQTGFSLIPQSSQAGLLGADWLSGFEVEIDLPHQRVALYRMHGCEGDYVPWLQPKTTLLVLLNVTVDGHAFRAKVDSGTTASMIGSTAVAAAELATPQLARDPEGRAIGTDERALPTRSHRFNTMQIGPLRYDNPRLVVTDLHLRQSNLLLGQDWLRHNRVWISYANHQVTIQAESPPTL
jgi:hypothetical protein